MSALATTQPTIPFLELNDRFSKQNAEFEQLLVRLTDKLHGLSNTNYPSPDEKGAKESAPLPFGEGHLMGYYCQLNGNNSLINALRGLVEKVESLI